MFIYIIFHKKNLYILILYYLYKMFLNKFENIQKEIIAFI